MMRYGGCRIWATEVSPRGDSHRCHAKNRGSEGGVCAIKNIEEVLRTTPTLDIGATWKLVACEPNHKGKCEGCQYEPWSGLSHFYDIKTQVRMLQQSRIEN